MNDLEIMKNVLKLAKKGEGLTSPNPMVGAIIVKNGKIISKGFHKKAGLAHAEAKAIDNAKTSLRGSRLFVNLEPCCIWGRTPPCVDKIISSGIREVVFSTLDPNPKVKGKSLKKLKKYGIKVNVGLLSNEARKMNEVFFKNMKEKKTFVSLKVAQSIDGKIATRSNKSKWITSLKARRYAKRVRDKYDAVLVGINTVIKDNPALSGIRRNPYKVVLDPSLKIPLKCELVSSHPHKLIIFSSRPYSKQKLSILRNKGVKIFNVNARKQIMPLRKIVDTLYRIGIMSVYVEGGSFTLGTFLDAKIADKVYFFIAPKIIGGDKAVTSVGAIGAAHPDGAVKIKDLHIERIGNDFLIIGYPEFKNEKRKRQD